MIAVIFALADEQSRARRSRPRCPRRPSRSLRRRTSQGGKSTRSVVFGEVSTPARYEAGEKPRWPRRPRSPGFRSPGADRSTVAGRTDRRNRFRQAERGVGSSKELRHSRAPRSPAIDDRSRGASAGRRAPGGPRGADSVVVNGPLSSPAARQPRPATRVPCTPHDPALRRGRRTAPPASRPSPAITGSGTYAGKPAVVVVFGRAQAYVAYVLSVPGCSVITRVAVP